MHQSPTSSLSQSIWPRWASRQFLSLPKVQTLLPVTFGYSVSSRKNLEAVVKRWRDERGCDKGHWHAHTRGLPRSLPEAVGTVRVHCSRRRLLQRGLEFHVCTINKSAHTSGNLLKAPLIYIHIYIYIYISASLHEQVVSQGFLKQSLTGLNSKFSFCETCYRTKTQRGQSALLFTHNGKKNWWIRTFPEGICAFWNAVSVKI